MCRVLWKRKGGLIEDPCVVRGGMWEVRWRKIGAERNGELNPDYGGQISTYQHIGYY